MSKITTILKKIFFTYSFVFSFSIYAQSDKCKIELVTDKGRNVKSTQKNGTFYKLTLTNLGKNKDTFTIYSKNINNSCNELENQIGTTSKRSNLKIKILDINKADCNSFTLNPGESIHFLIKIIVPENTPIDSWCCTQIISHSSNCETITSSTVLQTLVINSNDE